MGFYILVRFCVNVCGVVFVAFIVIILRGFYIKCWAEYFRCGIDWECWVVNV